jgi:hypothetical protein
MRRHIGRILACVFALVWLVPGFGAIDLTVTWDPDWPQVLEAGWGVFFTAIVAAPFVVVAVRPGAARPAVVQLAVAAAALAVSAPVASEAGVAALAAVLAVETALVAALLGLGWDLRRARDVSVPLLALGAVGAGPWLAYALDMWEANRENRFDSDVTNGVDHYSVQGALGLALAALPLLAGVRADLRRLVPACCGVAAAYVGLVSYAWPDAAGGFSRAWSVAAMAWGSALIAHAAIAVTRDRRR